MMNQFYSFYKGKTVFVTGHTGFKGSWLALWLQMLGAKVVGFSLPPESTHPALFTTAKVGEQMVSLFGDIRDIATLQSALTQFKPEIVFHMAAQSLVRRGYVDPITTVSTNVLGTTNLLETVRHCPSVRTVVVVTSDKCYENREWKYAYRENDAMGGYDPYSASKGAAELITASYRNSFFPISRIDDHRVAISSVRAGNVLGGGDWSDDRIVPDCAKALSKSQSIPVRNPRSTRPWQHVLEPLSGYLWLAVRMSYVPDFYSGAWNFGPSSVENATVQEIVNKVIEVWGSGRWVDISGQSAGALHESPALNLDSSKAGTLLGWKPVFTLSECLINTMEWYKHYFHDHQFCSRTYTQRQIRLYMDKARQQGTPWAKTYPARKVKGPDSATLEFAK